MLQTLPLGAAPRFPRRLAIAYQNLGHARRNGPEAIAAFTNALAVLNDECSARIPDRNYLQAAVWTNLAIARLPESEQLAREAAFHAIALVKDKEALEVDAAEVGLKARHVLCRTFAGALPGDLNDATDAVDDGLQLVRQWEKKGVPRFRDLACDLFRFGALVYQTHFLSEFLRENNDPRNSSPGYVKSLPPETRGL